MRGGGGGRIPPSLPDAMVHSETDQKVEQSNPVGLSAFTFPKKEKLWRLIFGYCRSRVPFSDFRRENNVVLGRVFVKDESGIREEGVKEGT